MDWSVIKLSDRDVSKSAAIKLQQQFESMFIAALGPKDAAMFGNLHPERDNHLFYFSPAATRLFSKFLVDASPCAAPSKISVALLVGVSDARETMLS
jgi:hypothetical protein